MPAGKQGLAVLLAAAALTGCGGSMEGTNTRSEDTNTRPKSTVGGDQRQILETIGALQSASRRGDGRKICKEVFTPQLARSIKKASGRRCPAEVRKRLFSRNESISVERVIEVDGSTATAVIREQNGNVSTLHMLKRAGRWRIDRVKPRRGS